MTQRTSRSYCVSMTKLIQISWFSTVHKSGNWLKHPASVMAWCFLSSSGLGSPLSRDGNEIQEVWQNNSCWHYVRAKVRSQTCLTCKSVYWANQGLWRMLDTFYTPADVFISDLLSPSYSLLMVFRLLLLIMVWMEEQHWPGWGLFVSQWTNLVWKETSFPVSILKQILCFEL